MKSARFLCIAVRGLTVKPPQRIALSAALLLMLVLGFPGILRAVECGLPVVVVPQNGVTFYAGTCTDGSEYVIHLPSNWNGTLFLYSHAYDPPGSPLNPRDDETSTVHIYLFSHGYALAASSYASSGWAIDSALPDQIAVLDTFSSVIGKPKRTIALGASLGGIVTAGLVQKYPGRFDGALSVSGILAGSVGFWNELLDAAFAFNTLLVPPGSGLQVVNITDPTCPLGNCNNLAIAANILSDAQNSPEGRARIALVAALIDSPGWTDFIDFPNNPNPPEPGRTDYATREVNQFVSLGVGIFFNAFDGRADIEARAGGNPSWNTGIDYENQLKRSVDYAEVRALYEQAGLSLDADLDTLNKAPRIAADPAAVKYLGQNISFNGDIDIPVVTLHTTGDDLINVQNEQAYAAVVRRGNDNKLLRELFVHRAGHLNVTDAEIIASMNALIHRLDTGDWEGIDPEDLNEAAASLGSPYQVLSFFGVSPISPAFVEYRPAPFLRPFDAPIQDRGKR